MRVLVALVLVGHGLVHAINVGQARRLYQVAPGAAWPEGSWALARAWGEAGTRWGVAIAFSLVAAAFAVAGVALWARAPWRGWVAGSAAFVSAVVLVLAWDGRLHGLGVQGAYAVSIDAAIVALALAVPWPAIDG